MRLDDKQKERFLAKIELKRSGCAEWQAALNNMGYAVFGIGYTRSSKGKPMGKTKLGHRLAYELYVCEIPEGLVLDHICRNTKCVNPNHLRAVTQSVNILNAAKSRCPHGHEFTEENTARYRGYRSCKECNRIRGRKYTSGAKEMNVA